MASTYVPARALERRVARVEDIEAWRHARVQARRVYLATVADRPDLALHAAGAIVTLADRRLRQIGGSDAA